MAFSKELEDVIEATLADGVITEKERAVLHKKALLEGVDPDEVDVVIDGRLQQMQNEVDKAKQKVRKCPSCGEIIPAMTAVCPSCGQVIDTSNPDNMALQKYMDKLETALVKLKEDGAKNFNHKVRAELEGMIRQGKAMYGDNKKINYLISEVEHSIKEFEKEHRVAKYKKLAIWMAILITPISWYLYSSISTNIENARIVSIAQNQSDSLRALLEKLEAPTKENYKKVEAQFLKIVWTDIAYSGEDEMIQEKIDNARSAFKQRRSAIADQIRCVYDDIYDCHDRMFENPYVPDALDDALYDKW